MLFNSPVILFKSFSPFAVITGQRDLGIQGVSDCESCQMPAFRFETPTLKPKRLDLPPGATVFVARQRFAVEMGCGWSRSAC
jgi:hypothetical protein